MTKGEAYVMLKSIEKRAQWVNHEASMYLMPKKQRDQLVKRVGPDSVVDASAQLTNVRGYRALASAARDAIPSTVEGITGLFSNKASDFVKEKFGDPWRRTLMSMGGNKVRDFFDNEAKRQKDEIVRRGGTREDAEQADALARRFEGVVKPVAETVYTWPAWGLAFRGIHGGGSVLGSGVTQIAQKAGVPARVSSIAGKSVPYATDAWMFRDIPISLYENLAPWSQTNKTKRKLEYLTELVRQSEDARQMAEVVPLTDEERGRRYKEYEDMKKRMFGL